jgi:N-acetyl sugar amidotransferase
MPVFQYPKPVNKEPFQQKGERTSLYGLPPQVIYCKECIISNQRPSSTVEFKNQGTSPKKVISFNEEGVCDACLVKRKKQQINWKEREAELRDLCDKHRSKDGSYDCLVPGSGGKDSFMQAHLLKYKYGMNPLTCTWAPHMYTDWGWRNHQAWIHAGFDNILFTPNGKVHRIITRVAVEKLLHPFQPFFLGQKNLAPKIADQYDIPLIFYGENEAEYGNARDENDTAKRKDEYFSTASEDSLYIGGASIDELLDMGISRGELSPYLPINKKNLSSKGIEVHYLGYYERWHPQGAYYYAVENGGFEPAPERSAGSYSKYNSIDDKIDDFHFHTYFTKFGLGRASYDASQEIRSGDLLREEGVALVKKYDGEFPDRWAKEIFEYLSLPSDRFPTASRAFEKPIFDRTYYDLLCENFRSPHLWDYSAENGWTLRHQVDNICNSNQEDQAVNWVGNRAR